MQTTSISAIQAAIPTARASTPTLPKHVPVTSEKQYKDFLSNMHFTLKSNFERSGQVFFTTDAEGLFAAYLSGFPDASAKQYHNCNCCRHFIERVGGLVTINAKGVIEPAFWREEDAPPEYKASIKAMRKIVSKAQVTGVFVSSDKVLGNFEQGGWTHLALLNPNICVDRVRTPFQVSAEKLEDFKTVTRALKDFSIDTVNIALTLLKSDALYRSEKVLGQAEWLHKLQTDMLAAKGKQVTNVIWLAIATAPAGFCHPRSSMIGTLLEDIASGMDFPKVSKRFADKMHPLSYQRPVAAPAAGAVKQAEALFEKLGAERSLERRFARLDEVQALWTPKPAIPQGTGTGLFGHVTTKKGIKPAAPASNVKVPTQTMTWVKFAATVLPTAESIKIAAPLMGSYCSLVTATHADAPPIIQWDNIGARNPISWYLYSGGSTAHQFNVVGGRAVEVTAITQKPSEWNGGMQHQGTGIIFLMKGAKDQRTPSLCLFPEILKAEFHGVRSVIEAHNKSGRISGINESSASGFLCDSKETWGINLYVTSGGQELQYRIDRMD
jgi:hypothetical protein